MILWPKLFCAQMSMEWWIIIAFCCNFFLLIWCFKGHMDRDRWKEIYLACYLGNWSVAIERSYGKLWSIDGKGFNSCSRICSRSENSLKCKHPLWKIKYCKRFPWLHLRLLILTKKTSILISLNKSNFSISHQLIKVQQYNEKSFNKTQ